MNKRYPFAETRSAKYVAARVEALKDFKTQTAIAFEAGYGQANVISMMKRGEMRIALHKVPELARAFSGDAAHLFLLTIVDYWPGAVEDVEGMFNTKISVNETAILNEIRLATEERDVALTPELRKRLRQIFR